MTMKTDAAVKVRIGNPGDFDQMMPFLMQMHAENGMAAMDPDLVAHSLLRGLHRDKAVVGIVDDEGKIAASVGLFVGRWWYSYDSHLEDFWNYVDPDYRKHHIARPVIEFAKRAADNIGVPLLMGVTSNERTAAKVRLYERQLPFVGAAFRYVPDVKEAACG
ncbi:GNAT family N-acetyltransferase [Acidisoma cellulosilytica]|uniref:GNAT family N-acetyltransferase n=1 Tax=Acidisoma cellulosilyticum TaxID=2802395 RepID=A0A963YZW8_9PROT|nr:GNAT family N-acetyltransferase [Acidisoma cellulosilyticum]MCB8880135.1 GNAT family N-acetyltransferase [Acidisoma cellulosilyticum]